MKKIISFALAASLMLLGTQAFAQATLNAGYINSTLAKESTSSNANGAYAGITVNMPLAGGLGIAPGVYYSVLFSKNTELFGFATGNFMEHAINVPMYLNYGFELARDAKFTIYGGPTAQYGLSSKVKHEIGSTTTTTDNYKDSNFNRFNVYLGGGVAFQASNVQITVGYDYGMMNQYKGDNAPKCHRSNLKIGVGFGF